MDRRYQRVTREILRLCHANLDSRTLRQQIVTQLRTVTHIESFWCATVDPSTLLFTGSVVDGIPEHATPAFLANEFLSDDMNKFVALARGVGIDSLFRATNGELGRSERYRDILSPLGFGDELRAALSTGGACWGVLCLHRHARDPVFSEEDITRLRQLAPHIAEGLRLALLCEEVTTERASDAPGLLVLTEDFSVIAATPAAEAWVAEMADWPPRQEVPQAVRAVAARLRELERTGEPGVRVMPRVRVRTRAGRWLVLHAARLSGRAPIGTIAVMFERAMPLEVAPLVLQAYSLTPREARVGQLVLLGYATAEIAQGLRISALTVQDHLKAIFDKTGVNSRREFVARIFASRSQQRA